MTEQQQYVGPERRVSDAHLAQIHLQLTHIATALGQLDTKLENHILDEAELISSLRRQSDYVNTKIEAEQIKRTFWREVLEKLAVSSIWGMILILLSIFWYAMLAFIKDKQNA